MALLGLFAFTIISLFANRSRAACQSYGVDFQSGGTYFQNASSPNPFTFVQYFEGCQSDVSSNIFMDPTGNEYQCTNTSMTPDDTNQLSTCPINKDQLYSGAWSIIVASNNGNSSPIAFERDFSLIVGVPTTITIYPTVTVTSTFTPTLTKSTTSTTTGTTTATSTVTSPSVTVQPITTVTPSTVTTTITSTTRTSTQTSIDVEPLVTVITYTQTCSIAPSQSSPDPTASVTPSILAARDVAPEPAFVARGVHEANIDSIRANKDAWLVARRERLAKAQRLQRRGLDKASTTITETNPSSFKTSTSTITASTTRTITATVVATSYSTVYTTSTVLSGTTTQRQFTITASTPTSTKTTSTAATVTTTITQSPLVTITVSTAPAASSSACKSAGGKLV